MQNIWKTIEYFYDQKLNTIFFNFTLPAFLNRTFFKGNQKKNILNTCFCQVNNRKYYNYLLSLFKFYNCIIEQ